jgi:FAD/FMN-containing dehydrogenase
MASSPLNMLQIRVLGGAMARVPKDAMAFAHRDKQYMFSVIAEWDDPAEVEQHRAWTETTWRKLESYGNGVYVNFLEDEGNKRIRQAYPAATYARLAVVKRRYDPTNLFRLNQNIQPQG